MEIGCYFYPQAIPFRTDVCREMFIHGFLRDMKGHYKVNNLIFCFPSILAYYAYFQR